MSMQASSEGIRLYRASNSDVMPDTSVAAATAPWQGDIPGGRFHAQAVIPSRLAPPPTSPLGLAGYSGDGPDLWFSSCHGGAGTSTLATLIPQGMNAGRYWPAPASPARSRVLLVARSHASGLCAAQAAARQWAAGVLPNVRLLGLVVVADAPGKRPKPLNDLVRLISGGVPRLWELPWVEALRLGDPPDQIKLPSAFSRLAGDVDRMISEEEHV
ncbi:hypothetical protein E1293_20685 [Actinomadura darangshiensis]|uniref:Uncharacterized protein n=1 Tax=Actinomadura darangshiensis TaxID=705336 RepID=A0A4R5B3U6_9ACTN|nr:DUF6668 family protein [Actinomadura darangshiensis]TDD80431.1 hypothetical protein E1293_20685 [Actinomadura darangshiensis]